MALTKYISSGNPIRTYDKNHSDKCNDDTALLRDTFMRCPDAGINYEKPEQLLIF